MLTQLTAKKFKGSVEWLSFHDEDRQGKLRFASYIILISNLPTFSMLHNVNQPKGWNPVSEQYDVYRWINLNAITVLTTLGISNVSPSKSFNFFVPHVTSCKKKRTGKWSTFTRCCLLRFISGGSICWPGSWRKAYFLASSILHFEKPGSKSTILTLNGHKQKS